MEQGKYYSLLHKRVVCRNTFYRMSHSPYPVVLPPPRYPPPTLLQNYTINGQCPISRFRYFDQSYGINNSSQTHSTKNMFKKLLELDNVTNINSYRDKNVLKSVLTKYKNLIQGKHVAVIGTERPWAEAMLVNLGASSITTIEYRRLFIDHERVTTISPYRMAELFLSGQAVAFDTVLSYSSIEHSGLGRYGDPLTPFGDLEASAQVWCMVKHQGHFILAVPVSADRIKCSIIWNLHRIYGTARLQHLTANWHVLDEFDTLDSGNNRIYILQKV